MFPSTGQQIKPRHPLALYIIKNRLYDADTRRADHQPVFKIDFPDLFSSSLFERGRPLWHRKYVELGTIKALVEYVTNLIFCKEDPSGGFDSVSSKIPSRYMSSVLFCMRLTGYKPMSSFTDDFVAHRLAIMTDICSVGNSGTRLSAMYRSEPILAEVSARYTCDIIDTHFTNVVNSFICEQPFIEPHSGDRGEFALCAGLLFTIDTIRDSLINDQGGYDPDCGRSMSCDVPARLLLEALGVNEAESAHFQMFNVNFSHFIRPPFASKAHFIHAHDRCAAILMPANAEGVDVVVMMYNPAGGKYGAILFQNKNLKSDKGRFTVDGATLVLNLCRLSFLDLWGDDLDSNAVVSALSCTSGETYTSNQWSADYLQEFVSYPMYALRSML